jgi:hypothetical protein
MKHLRILILFALASALSAAGPYQRIRIPSDAHPAVRSGAEILARKLGLAESSIEAVAKPAAASGILAIAIDPHAAKYDGYKIEFHAGGATLTGARPRSILYAAGDFTHWKDRSTGTYLREPSFAIRTATYDPARTVPDYIAELGVNILITRPNPTVVTLEKTLPDVFAQLSPSEQTRLKNARAAQQAINQAFVKSAHEADVDVYAFLYGNDPTGWSNALYQAAIRAYPSIKGTPQPRSWEKGYLCPSDPLTWKFIRAYVEDFMDGAGADGLYATFWDRYGIFCHDDRCQRNGLDQFPNELQVNVKEYREALHGKPLVVRTWASGSAHWLGEEYVHAPGYGHFSGEGEAIWGRVFKEDAPDIMIQTKAYDSDCEPDPRFNPLLGKAKPHKEIVEYQEAGQTLGRFYFPASSVDYMTSTIRKAHLLTGSDGGANVFPGGAMQPDYSPFNDIVNSVNLYAWRELSWDVNSAPEKMWTDWATPIYGAQAAPHIVKALRLSEEAVVRTFSPLGFGSSTNSDFPRTIDRRETLLQYTNRYYLPEYAKSLEPTTENILRVRAEKIEALAKIDEMLHELELAKPYLTNSQAEELTTRFNWLKEFAICTRYLDESLWRYRYLRGLAGMLTTDPSQMKELSAAYEAVKVHSKLLFQFDPRQKFSCYTTTLGQLRTKPALGSPLPLMKEIYDSSLQFVEKYTGPGAN